MVEEEDVNAFAAAMAKLLGDRALCRRMGKLGRELVMAKYTWQACAERYLEVFGRMTNTKSAPD